MTCFTGACSKGASFLSSRHVIVDNRKICRMHITIVWRCQGTGCALINDTFCLHIRLSCFHNFYISVLQEFVEEFPNVVGWASCIPAILLRMPRIYSKMIHNFSCSLRLDTLSLRLLTWLKSLKISLNINQHFLKHRTEHSSWPSLMIIIILSHRKPPSLSHCCWLFARYRKCVRCWCTTTHNDRSGSSKE